MAEGSKNRTIAGAIKGLFRDAVKVLLGRDDEPPPPKTKRRGDGSEGRGFTPRAVSFAEAAASIMGGVRPAIAKGLGFGATAAEATAMPSRLHARSGGHDVQTQFAAIAASSGSRRDGIGFVLETFDAASTVSLSDPLGGLGFEGGDMSGLDDGFDAFPDHDLHAL